MDPTWTQPDLTWTDLDPSLTIVDYLLQFMISVAPFARFVTSILLQQNNISLSIQKELLLGTFIEKFS